MQRLFLINKKILLRLFWSVVIFSFVVWFIALILEPQGKQLSLFFDRMHNFWADATNVTGMVVDNNPYFSKAKGSYPPLAYMFFYPLMLVSTTPIMTYSHGAPYLLYYYQPLWTVLFVIGLIITMLFLFNICISLFKNSRDFDVMMTGLGICISYPVLYTIERGNILLIAVLALSIFVFYYDSNCWWKKEIALISLAIASGIKLSPAIFGSLLILNKDWKSAFRAVCYGLVFFVLPFFFFKNGIQNLPQMINNVNYFLISYVADSNAMGTGLVTSYIKCVRFFINEDYDITLKTYSIIRVLTYEVSIVLFLGIFHFREKWKAVLNITLILLILPKVSLSYCAIYTIPLTVLFLKYCNDGDDRNLTIDNIIVLISLIMIFFVYRCPVSDFLNYNIAIPILTCIGVVYSIQAFVKSKHILPLEIFKR